MSKSDSRHWNTRNDVETMNKAIRHWPESCVVIVGHLEPFTAGTRHAKAINPSSSLRKNLETEPMFSQVRVDFWRWIELWSLRSAVDYAATSLGMRIRL